MSAIAPAFAPSPSVHDDVLSYFHFWPSRGIIIVALAFFSFTALTTLAVTIFTRKWYMLIATAVALMEVAGYAFRITMLTNPVYGYYVAMQCLLIIPPSFLALVEYLTLGRAVAVMREANPGIKSIMKPKLISWLYFAVELLSLALQGAGAGISVSNDGTADNESLGKALLMIGLALLVACIISFLINAIYIHTSSQFDVRGSRNMTTIFSVIYVTATLLLTRNIFRLIEFAGGWYGSLAVQEKYFYILDALLIFVILCFFTVFHYGIFLNMYPKEQRKSVSENVELV